MKPKIHFHYTYKGFPFKNRNTLKLYIIDLFKEERVALARLDYIFCSDLYLLQLNQNHLNHDTFTDIITFPLSNAGEPVLSDIYISIDRIKENAHLLNTSFSLELHRVIFHGALHLCGYGDKSKTEKKLMRSREDHYLSKYFVSRETL